MTRVLHRAALTRFAVRLGLGAGLGAGLAAGAVALALPGGAGPVALALGGLVALSGLGVGRRTRARATAPRRA